eukprot:gnl/TRDRNA2_/TRDRNA2_38597_c0_seq1.p1 gnl/TRDRNA2_/TRDRNA2_38597_c0~~gnl/TRDRNA2_/TRDRNA2_38597_c0_seq1.p1  ORF type:complete len:116 (+),score=13.44 gnl/TRDRNA2_/TRDRNA2_38597_c0_seq1:101-448(+)
MEPSYEPPGRTVQQAVVAAAAVASPFSLFLVAHRYGLLVKGWEVVWKYAGVYGFFAVPLCTLSMEKTIYDTVNAVQGIDPNEHPTRRAGEGFPSGGHLLPSFSLVAVRRPECITE